ncbi:hypothetical protein FVE85_2440 [Porphyridium purpureum]|uniref:Uncharacterized protein n=1 Tax=Porphyridium purpureum TaxID=35688 RepID=A0A5J4YJV0_PORPP|nr:hypothetical protein FVE85_2440 [Porphyridium purpureum]|eukprot:POR1842..scf291_13
MADIRLQAVHSVPASGPRGAGASDGGALDMADLLAGLGDEKQLMRERALLALRKWLGSSGANEDLGTVVDALLGALEKEAGAGHAEEQMWQLRCGLLLALRDVVLYLETHRVDPANGKDVSAVLKPQDEERMVQQAMIGVGRAELRERQAGAQLLGAMAKLRGAIVWRQTGDALLGSVEASFELDEKQRSQESAELVKRTANDSALQKSGTQLLHDTEGWRNLETSLSAVRCIFEACGAQIFMMASSESPASGDNVHARLLPLVLRAREHTNRFVRETALFVLTALVVGASECDQAKKDAQDTSLLALAERVAESIARGLDDNWSQVRFAGCVCAREFMSRLDPSHREAFYPLLLARMCLNRHYVAEGVRLYSQTSWKLVMGSQGRQTLTEYIANVVAYYTTQCDADNHAVREAACQAFSELATKLPDEAAVIPFIPSMLGALVNCFKDESWPVRDCACTASAQIVSRFGALSENGGAEACASFLPELHSLWVAHLADNIPTVRANSARALAELAAVFDGDHALCGAKRAVAECRALLPRVHEQPRDSKRYAAAQDTQFGASHKLARDNDPQLHENQTMYSCGSLAPKLKRGGGCMDHGFARHKQPWEETDGALRLFGALHRVHNKSIHPCAELLGDFVQLAAQMNTEFAHAPYLIETLWLSLIEALPAISKEQLEPFVAALLSPLHAAEKCNHPLAENAARSAGTKLRSKLGFTAWKQAHEAEQ